MPPNDSLIILRDPNDGSEAYLYEDDNGNWTLETSSGETFAPADVYVDSDAVAAVEGTVEVETLVSQGGVGDTPEVQADGTIDVVDQTHPLDDLEQSGATSGQVPEWDGSQWTPTSVSSGGGVDTSTASAGDHLYYDGSSTAWETPPSPSGGMSTGFGNGKGYAWNAEVSVELDSSQDDEIWSAIQTLKDTSAGDRTIDGGYIWLPAGSSWNETTPWTAFDHIYIEGVGGDTRPRIRFTDTSSQGLAANDVWQSGIDGVVLDGVDAAARDGSGEASVWRLNNTNSRQFNIGLNYGVTFENWGDPHFIHETGHPFNSRWGHIYQSDEGSGLGRLAKFEGGGEPLMIDVINIANHIDASSTDDEKGSGLHWKNSGGAFIIGMIECGASHYQRQLILDQGDGNTNIHARYVVMETSANNPLRVGDLDSKATVKIDDTRVQGNDVDEYYRFGFNNQDKWIGFRKIGNGSVLNNEITVDKQPNDVSYVLGSSSDVGNPNNYSTGLVRTLESAGAGNA